MNKTLLVFLGSAMMTAVVARASDASASISGVVSIPGYVCTQYTGTQRAYCPYFSQQSNYAGSNVGSIYVDAYLYSGSGIEAKACEESYSTGQFYCGAVSSTTGNDNYVDMYVSGFANISGAPKVQWDYYQVYMDNYTGGSFDVLGVGYF